MGWLKGLIWKLPYPLLLRVYYSWWLLWFMPRYERHRRRVGLSKSDELDLCHIKSSDTVFVLGSGRSINQINAERWQAISRANSIGFNMWLLHPFVPTLYFTEDLPPAEPFDSVFLQWAERRAQDYATVPKIVMDLVHRGERCYVKGLREIWTRNRFAAYSVPLLARNEAEFEYGLRYLVRKGCFGPARHLSFLFKHCGSLSTMVTLAARMGYRNIVLCGIDLHDTRYFYQDPELYPETAALEYLPRNETHPTNTQYAWSVVPISVVLRHLRSLVLEPAGIELYVENPASALYPEIPQAPEELFAEILAERRPVDAG